MSILSNLVAFYNGEEASGNLLDAAGAANLPAGAGANEPGSTTDNPGAGSKCRTFVNASKTYFVGQIQNWYQYSNTDFSMSAFLKVTNQTADRYIFTRNDTTDWVNLYEYLLRYVSASDIFRFQFRGDDGASYEVDSTVTVGTGWHHVTWGFKSDGASSYCWISVDNETKVTLPSDDVIKTNGTVFFRIGTTSNADASSAFEGRMCQFGAWDRELEQSEISWLYNGGIGRTYPFMGMSKAFFVFM